MAQKIIIDLEAKVDKALKGIEGLNKTIEKTGENSEKSLNSINTATKKTAKSTSILSKGFKGVGLAMKAAGFGLVMKMVDRLTEAFSSNQQVVDTMNVAFETVSIVVKQFTDIFSDVFGKVSEATGGFDALGKVLGGALSIAINSIALTIQGITLGIQKARLAWEQSFLGGKDKETIKELNLSILETRTNIVETGDRIKNSGKQIADNFVEAVGEVGTLAVGVAEAVTETIDKIDIKQAKSDAEKLVKSQKNFELLALQQQRLVEQYDLQAEQQRQIRDDESKSIADRIKANEELGKILLQQNEAEKKTVDARISAVQQEISLKGNTVELSNQLYELQTERLAIDAKVAGFQSEQLTNINSLKKEQLDLTKSQGESENNLSIKKKRFNAELIEDELTKLEKLKEIDLLEQEREQTRLQSLVDNANAGTQAKIDAQIALDEFTEQSRQTNIQRDKDISKAKEAINKAEEVSAKEKTKAVGNALNQLTDIAGQNTVVGKGLAVAAATINTYQGVTDALAAKTVTPFDTALKFINAAAILSNGLKTVKQITSVKIPEASGGSGAAGASTPSGGGISQPPAFNVVGASNTNQLAEAIGSQSKEPVKAYVVANDVSTAQSMDRNIVEGASI
ncbi:MAG: hypothetical protein GY820_24625 [Gammaproteobacteria bacterium]|uniref:hypothetical protein n=1 Tax=Herbaspirillum sp. TaxID=1890675 RepID=UPI00258EDFB0|nr:hypothetical protein [Herbaspirillum sp.]MCP3656324.1 hypothetical protein [Herbaspirillum sp.]MCP4490473.1 hypothetical protein [Gammaproteobacteria bacterium]